jgi:hypothetical protein
MHAVNRKLSAGAVLGELFVFRDERSLHGANGEVHATEIRAAFDLTGGACGNLQEIAGTQYQNW